MAHVFANNASKLSSDMFSFKYQNCFWCLTTGLCKVRMRTADADSGWRMADGGRRTADGRRDSYKKKIRNK